MCDYLGHGFHTLSAIKYLKAKVLLVGGQWSNLVEYIGTATNADIKYCVK